MYEKLITVATMLFILSMISERVITFFKLWCVKGNSFLFIIVSKEMDTSQKYENEEMENKRERAIVAMNLTISFLIALISKASLFKMFTYDNNSDLEFLLGWDFPNLTFHEFFSSLIGCGLTACFISIGSKFWHDMLDMLFYAKNLKEKLVDKATYEMNSLKMSDTWINTPEYEIIDKVFEENLKSLEEIENVISVGKVNDNRSNYIEVQTTSENHSKIPDFLTYRLPNGETRKYPIKVIVSSPIVTHGSLAFKSDITNQERLTNFGSFGLGVKFKKSDGKKKMLLTCYHVIIGDNDDYFSFKYTKNDQVISPYNEEDSVIGTVRDAIRNDKIDAAIIDINDYVTISNKVKGGKEVKKTRVIKQGEQYGTVSVKMFGFKNSSTGKIKSINNYTSIVYTLPNGEKKNWEMYGLISVSNYGKCISQEGDSGSALLDTDDNVIGIVVAGNDTTTYAIPIETIFNQLNIELL